MPTGKRKPAWKKEIKKHRMAPLFLGWELRENFGYIFRGLKAKGSAKKKAANLALQIRFDRKRIISLAQQGLISMQTTNRLINEAFRICRLKESGKLKAEQAIAFLNTVEHFINSFPE